MNKKDFRATLIVGVCIGVFAALIVKSLESESPFLYNLGLHGWHMAAIVLACFGLVVLALGIASVIGRKLPTLYELVKFFVVGGLNTLVDFGILNILMLIFSAATGGIFTLFKAISFIGAVVNSYVWNKFWTFSSHEKTDVHRLIRFLSVSIVGFGLNVVIASLIVNFISPLGGMSEQLWANVGAIIATVISMIWNFIGYKFFVFHRKRGTLFTGKAS